jgi:hypothetical protein
MLALDYAHIPVLEKRAGLHYSHFSPLSNYPSLPPQSLPNPTFLKPTSNPRRPVSDKDLLVLKEFANIPIVTPRQFLASIGM